MMPPSLPSTQHSVDSERPRAEEEVDQPSPGRLTPRIPSSLSVSPPPPSSFVSFPTDDTSIALRLPAALDVSLALDPTPIPPSEEQHGDDADADEELLKTAHPDRHMRPQSLAFSVPASSDVSGSAITAESSSSSTESEAPAPPRPGSGRRPGEAQRPPHQPCADGGPRDLRPIFPGRNMGTPRGGRYTAVVISGGSGFNELVGATPGATYIMPISDNGGSSSEIIRVLGGPSLGDLRSRLVRLIRLNAQDRPSAAAIHRLLSYRLPTHASSREVKQEWLDIVEGKHRLWKGIENDRKECIRGFLVHFEAEILRRSHRNFNFRGGSIGNFFLSASQMFFRSIQSAVFLFSAITRIGEMGDGSDGASTGRVIPCINTNYTATIAAKLAGAKGIVVGQCEISHPARLSEPIVQPPSPSTSVISLDPSPSPVFGHPSHHLAPSSTPLSVGAGIGVGGAPAAGSGTVSSHAPHYFVGGSGAPRGGLSSRFTSGMGTPAELEPEMGDVGEPMALQPGPIGYGLNFDGASWRHNEGVEEDDDEEEYDGVEGGDQRSEGGGDEKRGEDGKEDGDEEGNMGNILFSKASDEGVGAGALPARIERIFYINSYRNEVYPNPNPDYLTSLKNNEVLIYSCGSLYTSIIPCLSLRGVARAIARSPRLRYKVLLLNTSHDRETAGMTAVDYVHAIIGALNWHSVRQKYSPSELLTHMVYFEEGEVKVDTEPLRAMGIRCVKARPSRAALETQERELNKVEPAGQEGEGQRKKVKPPMFDEETLREALERVVEVW